MSIQELSSKTINLIKSSQVISSLSSIVKELIENALDAQASILSVKLENSGYDKIEVKDNGVGISENDIKYVAQPHFTSKIKSFEDLDYLRTYGFRGEALSSLCAVSDLTITTKKESEPLGFSYRMDHCGNVIDRKPAAITTGTSITAKNIFRNIPVRRQYYTNIKRQKEELRKVENLVKAFAVIKPMLHISLIHNKCIIFQKSASNEIKHSIHFVFRDVAPKLICNQNKDENIVIQLWLPKEYITMCSCSSSDKLVIAINGRPVSHKIIEKLIKSYYSHNAEDTHGRYPVGVILINVPPNFIDVNLEPNKTKILFKDEDLIIEKLQFLLQDIYGEILPSQKSKILENGSYLPCTLGAPTQSNEILSNSYDNLSPDMPRSSSFPSFKEETKSFLMLNEINSMNSFNNNVTTSEPKTMDSISTDITSRIQNNSNINPEKEKTNTGVNNRTQDSSFVTLNSIDFKENTSIDNFEKYHHSITDVSLNLPNDQYKNELDQHANVSPETNCDKINSLNFNFKSNSNSTNNELPHSNTFCESDVFVESSNNHTGIQCISSYAKEPETLNIKQIISEPAESFDEISNGKSLELNVETQNKWSTGNLFMGSNNIQSVSLLEPPKITSTPIPLKLESPKITSNPVPPNLETTNITSTQVPTNLEPTKVTSTSVHPNLVSPKITSTLIPPKRQSSAESGNETGNKKFKIQTTKNPKNIIVNYLSQSSPQRRPTSAFSLFVQTTRKDVNDAHPGAVASVIAQELVKKWKELDTETRRMYEERVSDQRSPVKIAEINSPVVKKKFQSILKEKFWQKNFINAPFDIQNLKERLLRRKSRKIPESTERLIGSLKGMNGWLFRSDNRICALNASRMNELVILDMISGSFGVPTLKLQNPIQLDPSNIGIDNWTTLLSLERRLSPSANDFTLIDPRIASNGFKIILSRSESIGLANGSIGGIEAAHVVAMTDVTDGFGIENLKEILVQLRRNPRLSLRGSRPAVFSPWLKTQAMRMSRASPHITDYSVIMEKFRTFSNTFLGTKPLSTFCLHGRPVFDVITTFK